MIGPPKIRLLEKRHKDEITEDVSDRIFALVGTNTHSIVERIKHPDAIQEERLYIKVMGWNISGQADLYEDGIISDLKVTSVYAVLHGLKPEWIAQANLYKIMFESAGFPVTGLQVIAILRDWSKFGHQKSHDYPRKQVKVLPVPMWSDEKAKTYIYGRVRAHKTAELMPRR